MRERGELQPGAVRKRESRDAPRAKREGAAASGRNAREQDTGDRAPGRRAGLVFGEELTDHTKELELGVKGRRRSEKQLERMRRWKEKQQTAGGSAITNLRCVSVLGY